MKSRVFQAILIIILFAVGVVIFNSMKSDDSSAPDQSQNLVP